MSQQRPQPFKIEELEKSDHLLATLRGIAMVVSIASTAMIPVVAFTTTNRPEIATVSIIAAVSWISMWMLRSKSHQYVAHLFIFSCLAIATFGVYASGSIRSSIVFLFVGAVAAAGVFLEKKAVIFATLYSIATLGVFTWAELNDFLHKPNIDVGLKVWGTQAICILSVGLMVYFSRARATESHERQMSELLKRRETEHERDLAQERFARIFRSNPSPMLAQSAVTSLIVDVNPAFERCFGYTKAELLGRSDTFLWVETKLRFDYKERLFNEHRISQEPVKGLRSDGTVFEATLSSELSNEPGDELIISIVADVSSEHASVENLRRSEERFAKAFNFSPLHLTITRMSDGSLVEANHSASKVMGHAGKDDTHLELDFWSHETNRVSLSRRLQDEGGIRAYDTQVRQKNGAVVDCRIWAEPIEIDGESCVISCAVNVTEEKRREAQLLDLANGMSNHTGQAFFTELVGNMAKTMGADMVLVGEMREHECAQVDTLAVAVDGQITPNFAYPLEGTPCRLASQQAELCVYLDKVDELFPTDLPLVEGGYKAYVGQSLCDDAGKPIGVLVAMWRTPIANKSESSALMAIYGGRANAELLRLQRDREIQTLNETLENRVQVRTAELEELNAELDAFAYSVSHDLKTPLRSIDGYTHLLAEDLEGRLSPEEKKLFDRIQSSCQRMGVLITDMLGLAHISQTELHLESVNLSDMFLRIAKEAVAQSHHINAVELVVEPGISAVCDPRLMEVALENLIGNATKYTRDQVQPKIEFGRHKGSTSAPTEWFIRDNGIGFDMALADKLFMPFQRLHAPSTGFKGTGIGLATVRRVVERHGGKIRGEAIPDQGATFVFSLSKEGR